MLIVPYYTDCKVSVARNAIYLCCFAARTGCQPALPLFKTLLQPVSYSHHRVPRRPLCPVFLFPILILLFSFDIWNPLDWLALQDRPRYGRGPRYRSRRQRSSARRLAASTRIGGFLLRGVARALPWLWKRHGSPRRLTYRVSIMGQGARELGVGRGGPSLLTEVDPDGRRHHQHLVFLGNSHCASLFLGSRGRRRLLRGGRTTKGLCRRVSAARRRHCSVIVVDFE